MELFHKIYSCYYNVVRHILDEAGHSPITRQDMEDICRAYGFQESALSIIPKLTDKHMGPSGRTGQTYLYVPSGPCCSCAPSHEPPESMAEIPDTGPPFPTVFHRQAVRTSGRGMGRSALPLP